MKRNDTSKKAFREMSAAERARHSLSAQIFRATLIGSIVFGTVALLIGLSLYTGALVGQYINQAVGVTPSAATSARHGTNSVAVVREVMSIYHSLSAEEREKMGTPEYRALLG